MLAAVLTVAGSMQVARAQDTGAQDLTAAAEAFDRGTRSYLARDFATAAGWFETAYRMAPAPAALIQAVRSHERAGNVERAATLALRLQAAFPDDAAAQRQAEQALATAQELVRINVSCDASCTLELDGRLLEHPAFFVAPATEHTVRATFASGSVQETISGAAGETRVLSLVAPPIVASTPTVEPAASSSSPPAQTTPPTSSPTPASGPGGLHVAIGLSALGATVVSGALLTWSGVDTLDGVPAYQADPTPERLADGQGRETRTNVLIGVTSALAVTTAVLMIFTDWGGQAEDDVRVAVVPNPSGVAAEIQGAF